ncbi:uncharacterized protein LOC121725777 [Aricia agestis]|uniref:uncharacterized protein LOC121725777 n=1 Tax=Aricia agestis TaxID=91739 RepID=UPI001C206688|nr:uncharacterized protein LOC121725777 [Aricia agestis]
MLNKTIDECTANDLKNKIEHDQFLKMLYKRFNEQFQLTYNWQNIYQDKKFLEVFFSFMKNQGPKTSCYREILAHIFNINIRIYTANNEKIFTLLDNHNGSSSSIIYFLYNDGKFSEIDINSEYLNLNKNRENMDNIFFKILSDIYALNSTNALLEYFENFDVTLSKQDVQLNQIRQENLNEQKEIDEISEFFSIYEREQIKSNLQKIASNLIGHSGIIHIILQRFQYEGRYVSIKEIRYLVNVILSSHLNNEKLENKISWIIATVNQSNWIAELILIELESFFKKRLDKTSEIQMYLTKINPDILIIFGIKLYKYQQQNVFMSSLYVEDTLYLLSNIEYAYTNLEHIELSEWLYILKEYYWINKINKLFKWNRNDLESVPYYILSLDNMFGMSVISEFLDVLASKNILKIQDINTFDGILQNFVDERWNLGIEEMNQLRSTNSLSEWVAILDNKFYASDTERNGEQLVNLIKGNSNTSKHVLELLPKILNILYSVNNNKYFVDNVDVRNMTENDIIKYAQQIQSYKKKDIEFEQLLSVINRAIELKRNFQLRDTQKLTIMSLLLNENNTLAQVATGEGKSLIVVAISIMKALNGEKVDIVTSSSVLAMRDAVINEDIYDLFNVRVGHNCSEVIKNRKETYSTSKVIYGDLSNFQRDYLLDRFYGENILGDHDFCNIIIDEVDSMLLDKGNNTIYLSHDIAGLDKLESVYVYIWCNVNRPMQDATNISEFMNISKIKESILSDMFGILKKSDIEKLDREIDEIKKIKIWNFLVNNEIIERNGRLIAQNMSNVNLDKLPTDLLYLKEQIMYMLRECIERQRFIYVPKYLNNFIEKHLESWIESAFAAFYMTAGHDYVVDVDRTKTISDGNPIITIIDRATGTDQISAQWDNALHQFLQLKHGCKLTMQSLKAVFISNVSYFKLYRKLYGLTGTLGSERERNLLKEVHMVDFVTVPTAKSKQFHECIPIVCKNKEIWIKNIHNEVETVVNKEMRSILIICQYVEDVELIQKSLTNKGIQNIYTYTRDYEEFDIARGIKKLRRSQIIIATNLAGRGTDIILTDHLRLNGGLHVCLTYLPTNTRIERQAFGRAARSGDKGTGRLIFVDGSYEGSVTCKVWNLKKERDLEEVNRISSINVEYNNKIKNEEKCFDKFKKLFEKIKNHLTTSNIAPEVKSILLQCCLDNWAFWLDDKTCDKFTEDYGNLNESFKLFYDHLDNLTCDLTRVGVSEFITQKCYDLVKQNPIAMVILGKYFLTQNNFEQALALFNTVIKNETNFSEAAHYYKAFTISKQINWEYLETLPQIRLLVPFAPDITKNERKLFKDALLKSAKLFKDQAERLLYNATMIDKIKENYPDSIIQIEAYTQQQQIFSNFYNMFVKSVDDILGNPVTYQNFSSIDINEQQAQDVYDKLLEEGFLNQTKLKRSVNEMQLDPICRDFGISSKVLHSFLDRYKNQYFDVKVFIKDLKNHIHLPSCGNFWSILLEQGIIFKEVKYVIVDEIILHNTDPSFLDLLTKKISSGNIRTFDDKPFNDSDSTKTIFLSGICIKEQKNKNNLILYKNELKSLNPSKYSILKKKGALTFNKMAYIDTTKITGANFEQHDSIVLEDFNKIKINKEQATELLFELSSEGIIEEKRRNKNQFVHKLKVQYEKIFEIKLKSREIYKSNVIGLLLSCFAYRIAIQKLQRQLLEKEQNVCIQLMTKPHYALFYELIEQNIIKNVKVTNKRTITEECVKNVFGLPISKEKFIQTLNNSGIVPIGKAPELFDDLVRANWLKHCNVFGQVLHGKLYEVTPFDGNQQALNYDFQPFQESLKIFLNHKSILGNENSIRSLTKTLNQLKSSIKSLSVPDNTLKPLAEICGSNKFSNVDELHIMSLNGLDHIQQFEEKKHTVKMLISTAVVFGFGLIQLAVGVIILYYSMGFMTHIGSILISEGISDMLYSTSAYRSGYFSWNDYLNHKIKSLIFSAITVGVGAIFSWGVRYSRFGYKLFGPALQETCGKELVKKTGTMAIVKSISVEALKGISICAANYGADALIDRHLKSFCENVGSAIRTNIETQVDSNKLSSRLETVYKIYGSSKAKKALSEITDSFFHNHNIGNNMLPTAMKISNSIVKGVKEAANKEKLVGSRALFTVNIIGKILVWSNRANDLYKIKNITEHFIDNLCKEIDEKLIKTKDIQESSSEDGKFCQEQYYDFKKEITENWKHILRQQSGQVISQNIISPILEDCLHELIKFCGKKIKDIYRFTKEKSLEAKLRELRQQFKKDLTEAKTKLVTAGTETEKAITDQYHANVLKLLAETKNPHLFATMILENIPMDLTCALTSGPVIEAVLKERGIVKPGLSIVFNTAEGIKQEVLIGPKSANKQTIVLELINNHYQISGINNSSNSNLESPQNDCLYQALTEVIPELRELGPNNFRTAMAKQIIENPEIRCHIENGWHRYPIRLKLYGGAKKNNRQRVSRREDPESTEQSDLIKDPAAHLYDRFIRLFRFAGTAQRISTDIAIPRENVVREGASEYQDRNSKLGREYHAAHVIRATIDTSVDPQRHAEAFVELRNILGHTQIVPRFANEYHGIGGVIDDIEGDALRMASFCNFASDLRSNTEILNGVKKMFVDNIKDFLRDSDRLTESNRRDIERSLGRIWKTSPREMYKSGRDGFTGKYRYAYM